MHKIARKTLLYSVLMILMLYSCAPKTKSGYSEERGYEGNISVSGAFALYPLVVLWSEDFKKIHPHVRFNISAGGAGKGIADALTEMVDIGLVSRDLHPQEIERHAYPIHVAKDAVICTINSNHPNYAILMERGVTRIELENLFVLKKYKTWNELDARLTKEPIAIYVRSDAAGAAETWANFLGHKQEDLSGVGIFGDPGIAQAIKDAPNAIGFNNINYVYDLKTKKVAKDIDVLPLDLNENGKIDEEESFYRSIDDLTEAVSKGRYPSPPSRNLTFVTRGKPESALIRKFIAFVLEKQSQSILLENGYVPLHQDVVDIELKKIQNVQ